MQLYFHLWQAGCNGDRAPDPRTARGAASSEPGYGGGGGAKAVGGGGVGVAGGRGGGGGQDPLPGHRVSYCMSIYTFRCYLWGSSLKDTVMR